MAHIPIQLTATTTVVAALTSQYERIVITGLHLQFASGASQTVVIHAVNQAGGTTALTGTMLQGVPPIENENGIFTLEPGQGIRLALLNATPVSGWIKYKVAGAPYRQAAGLFNLFSKKAT